MNITAEKVTGHIFVVAWNETAALEAFGKNTSLVFTEERQAVDEERERNEYARVMGGDDPILNTYKITVTAEKVH